ncbi:MAG: hypothetical protein GY806_17035 [Gammaproteobacteria bacterium]|nr:hypothetical protein [Gammaproteobacteria bacterium]
MPFMRVRVLFMVVGLISLSSALAGKNAKVEARIEAVISHVVEPTIDQKRSRIPGIHKSDG